MLMPADAVSSMLSDKRALKIFPKKRKYECVEEPQDQEDLPDPSPLPGPSNAHDLPSQSVNMLQTCLPLRFYRNFYGKTSKLR